MKNVRVNTYYKLYERGVIPIYWDIGRIKHSEITQNKAIRYYLMVHNFTPIPALHAEMGWL